MSTNLIQVTRPIMGSKDTIQTHLFEPGLYQVPDDMPAVLAEQFIIAGAARVVVQDAVVFEAVEEAQEADGASDKGPGKTTRNKAK
jgi:hypothetical protein